MRFLSTCGKGANMCCHITVPFRADAVECLAAPGRVGAKRDMRVATRRSAWISQMMCGTSARMARRPSTSRNLTAGPVAAAGAATGRATFATIRNAYSVINDPCVQSYTTFGPAEPTTTSRRSHFWESLPGERGRPHEQRVQWVLQEACFIYGQGACCSLTCGQEACCFV